MCKLSNICLSFTNILTYLKYTSFWKTLLYIIFLLFKGRIFSCTNGSISSDTLADLVPLHIYSNESIAYCLLCMLTVHYNNV